MASTLTSHTRTAAILLSLLHIVQCPILLTKPIHSKRRSHPKNRYVVLLPGVPLPLTKHPLAMLIQKKEHPLTMPYQKNKSFVVSLYNSQNTPSPCLIQKKEHLLAMPHPKKEHPLAVPYQKTKEHPLTMLIQKKSIPLQLTEHPLTVPHPKKRPPPHRAHPKKKNTPLLCSSKKKEHPLTVLIQKKKNTPLLCLIHKKEHPLAVLIQKKGCGIPLPLTEHPLAVSHPTKDNKTQMVKTKQTAKKTTGGRTPRVSLAGLKAREKHAAKSSKAHARKAPVAKKRRMRNLAIPEDCLAEVTQLPVTFRCVSCHWKMTRFESPQPYFGFYLSGKPVLKHPLVVIGGFEHATTSEVAGNSTAIIHLHLESLELGHASVHILHTMLQGYFRQDTYHFSQLPFNFATEESRAAYDTAASKLASSLTTFAKVVIFLSTHTDEDRGDLFSGMENKVPIATEVFELQFLQGLLLPLSNIVKGGDLIFFVCGSTVRKEQSFQGLKAAVQHFKPRSMLLFDAERLQLVTTIPFLMSVLDSTLVQGFHVQSAVRHSNIILMLWQEKVVVEKFVWTDKFIRPWGQQLPAQCPQCYSIQKLEAGCSGQTYSYECKNPGCGKDTQGTSQPPQTYTICMSKGATKLTQGKGQTSSWLWESL
ncbi:hypothetical protein F5J12DRAFT_782997 [Pisolithus orientalis]|uniref:uncharacterized protein n=1 Tax=Pisolithus orientalis TaxID=936130 RepID=UPI00222425A4|nr:uncharacterized protein F5J12DRAFT_782997 [Pisolithus orientalis]KAI6006217.1 hypothetical protein F5J12DRAFT_782997 [Pisolithus orientalis]